MSGKVILETDKAMPVEQVRRGLEPYVGRRVRVIACYPGRTKKIPVPKYLVELA
ncbi:MAG: hypothetical protein HYT72_05110 [Candidatus Aenigmarchaeota archaeon]|nr:hypothetical protein [Candidatus Aenigmarchaeota archaeon]